MSVCLWVFVYVCLFASPSVTNIANVIFTARRLCIVQTMPWQDVYASVRMSHAGILSKWLHISAKFLHCWVARPATIRFLNGVSNARGMKNSRFVLVTPQQFAETGNSRLSTKSTMLNSTLSPVSVYQALVALLKTKKSGLSELKPSWKIW